MRVKIVAVGKLKEKYWLEAVREYTKRLSSYIRLEIVEVSDEKAPENLSPAQEEEVKTKEGRRILAQLGERDYVIPLAIEGKAVTSEALAAMLDSLALNGRADIAFVIGGSLGLSKEVLQRGDQALSLSAMTFPHQMARVVLLEQLYRAVKISRGEPYHK